MRLGSNGSLAGGGFTLSSTASFIENGSPVVLAGNAQIVDAELAATSFNGATLQLERSFDHTGGSGYYREDLYSGAGIVAGQASGTVTIAATDIGTYTWSSGELVITFNANATQALVNQAMQAIAYSNSSDAPYPAGVTIYWVFNDRNSTAQGTGGAKTIVGRTSVNITAVNDAPTSTDSRLTMNEDTVRVLTAADFGSFTDIDRDELSGITITTLPAAGRLEYNSGTWSAVTLNQVISKADIDAGKLRFTPVANAYGAAYASIGFKVGDGTTESASAYTLTVNVSAVNDAPTSTDSSLTMDEDTVRALTASDFGSFADIDGNLLSGITITTLPAAGALEYNSGTWSAVTLNQVISKADIDAGKLRFTPVANAY
ncbi:MAG: hypothetical protein ACR2I0_10220, partial [Rhodoferax sp.]